MRDSYILHWYIMKIIRPIDITTSGTFARASNGTYFDKLGVMQTAALNEPRIDYDPVTHEMKGVMIEAAGQNLASITSPGVATSIEAAAGTFTISFYGTGVVTLSGTATAVINGTGATPVRTTSTFTKTAGTLNITYTGTVDYLQLETGSVATSYIAVTLANPTGLRAADIVTGTGYIYSNLTEDEVPEWNAATNYSTGTDVMRVSKHKIYRNFIAGVNATAPENDVSGRWLEVSPTNRWKAFDASLTTITSNVNKITYILKPGRINGLALLGLNATFIEVALTANGETVYSGSADLLTGSTVGDWYEYFYEPIYQRDALVITELIDTTLLNLPAYGDSLLSITIEYDGNTPSVAAIVTGLVADIGLTNYDASVSIVDYSKIETDTFGRTSVVKRGFRKRGNFPLTIKNNVVDNVIRMLSLYRATPIVYVGTENIYSSLVIYGYYKDWEVTFTEPSVSRGNIQIEGLSQ